MRIIDFHNHYYPPAYLDALRSGSSAVEVTVDQDGNPRIYYPGDYNIAVPGHRDIDYREWGRLDQQRRHFYASFECGQLHKYRSRTKHKWLCYDPNLQWHYRGKDCADTCGRRQHYDTYAKWFDDVDLGNLRQRNCDSNQRRW